MGRRQNVPPLLALVVLAACGIPWLIAISLCLPVVIMWLLPMSVPIFPSYGDTTSVWVQGPALG